MHMANTQLESPIGELIKLGLCTKAINDGHVLVASRQVLWGYFKYTIKTTRLVLSLLRTGYYTVGVVNKEVACSGEMGSKMVVVTYDLTLGSRKSIHSTCLYPKFEASTLTVS